MGATGDYTRGGGVSGADRIAAGASTFCGGIMSLTSWNVSTGASTTAGADANVQTDIVVHGDCEAGVGVSELPVPAACDPAIRFSAAASPGAIIPGMSAMAAVAPFGEMPPVGIGQPGPPASDVSCRARNPNTRETRL